MNKPKKYISNKKLYEAMTEYQMKLKECEANGVDKPLISSYIGECITLICNNLSKKINFVGYSQQWKQEMISDAILDCIAAVDNFDNTKTNNPFAYFTQIAWNAFIRRIHKEKKQTYIKHKNFENIYLLNNLWEEFETVTMKMNEHSNEIIKSYENNLTKEKKNNKKVGFEKIIEVNNE